jgi:hypothetical protein
MRDCESLYMTNGFPLTCNSLLLTQPPTSLQFSSPICVRVLVRVVGAVGAVEKVILICFRLILATVYLIVLAHDIFDRGFERELVDHYGSQWKPRH